MILYDVCRLFTSIALKETIELAVNLIFDKYPDLKIAIQKPKDLFHLRFLKHTFFLMATIMISLNKLPWSFLWVLCWLTYLCVFMKKDG